MIRRTVDVISRPVGSRAWRRAARRIGSFGQRAETLPLLTGSQMMPAVALTRPGQRMTSGRERKTSDGAGVLQARQTCRLLSKASPGALHRDHVYQCIVP